MRSLSGAGIAQLDARIRTVDAEIAQLRREQERPRMSALSAALKGGDALLMGRQPLFQDAFTGHEEVARNARPGGRRNNPLEVLIDAGMKAFDI